MTAIMTRLLGALALLGLGLVIAAASPGAAQAQNCTASVTDVDFGQPDLLSGNPVDTLANVHISCSNVPVFDVVKACLGLRSGSGGAASAVRYMVGPTGETLAYQLYQDASRTTIWGDIGGAYGAPPGVLLGTGILVSPEADVPIYARLFPNQAGVPQGDYVSEFSGAEVQFALRLIPYAGANTDCTGFTPFRTIRPSFEVRALVQPSCRISTTDLNFGQIGTLSSPVQATSQLTVQCAAGAAYAVSLDNGQSGTGPEDRRMTSAGGDTVTYGLYKDEARTLPWGQTLATDLEGVGTGSKETYPVYGQTPAQTTPPAAVYSDRVTATVTY